MDSDDTTDEWRDISGDVLQTRLLALLSVHYPDCKDEEYGGYIPQLDPDTLAVYNRTAKHLVATCRYVSNFSIGVVLNGPAWCRRAAIHGLEFLRESHYDPETGGYEWLLEGREPVDRRRSCYGHAFVLLAYARATEAGLPGADSLLEETARLIDERFWDPEHDLCRSELAPTWEAAEPYRGQNANMHACEAYLVAYEATGEDAYLERATATARRLTVDLAAETDGLLWEHYTADWTHDFAYNRDDPTHLFRPWGYQPGHHIEWAKLLATIDRHRETDWALPRARELFDVATTTGWDDAFGGFYYTFDREGEPIVDDKYGWTVAEGIGAAAALFERTDDERYREWYARLWEHARINFVADSGRWYEKRTREHEPIPRGDGPNVEPDYHPIGAYYEGLRSFGLKSP
ncbi:AGE family epimerase/isomerase [Haloferacaceae archaeon DSL9]